MRVITLVLGLLCVSVSAVSAQSFSLPKIDSINVYGQLGEFEGKHLVDAHQYTPANFGSYGWGFESSFDVLVKDDYAVELAVGYDQLFVQAKLDDRFSLHGTLRNLPAISAYVSFNNHTYVGLGTGLASFSNSSIQDSTGRYSFSGDTFDLAAKAGVTFALDRSTALKDRRVDAFIEGSYHARILGGVNYGTGAPADLPSRLFVGGVVVTAGVQISLKSSDTLTDSKIKVEAQRQQQKFDALSPSKGNAIMKTVCAGTQIEPGWVLTDTRWDPASCSRAGAIEQNVWELTRVSEDDDPGVVEICASAHIPDKWTKVDTRWVPGRCGAGADQIVQNVIVIKR